jgi:adenylate cyclase
VAPQGQADMFYTPHFSLTGQPMAGVEIQGHILHTLLTGTAGQIFPARGRVLLSIVLLLLAGPGFARLSPLTGLGVLLAAVAGLGSLALYLFWQHQWWLPPVLLSLGLAACYGGNALCHYLLAAREKRWLRQAFSRYVSSSLVEMITAQPERLRLGGDKVEVTVMFADLAGFTTISEGLSPEKLIHLLNEYFTAMTEIILAHQGTVDKYIGDAIMAFWGAPLPVVKPATLACQAALAMHRELEPLQHRFQQHGLPPVEARIGLHTGLAIVGNVGSKERFNYTVMGDTVNLASRLEGVNKIYGTHILLSESTFNQIQDEFLCRELDLVRVKGRQQPVAIYELLGDKTARAQFPWLAPFTAGLAAYRQGQWNKAAARFQEVLTQRPGDPPTLCFLQRLATYQQQPPPPDWQGVFSLETK